MFIRATSSIYRYRKADNVVCGTEAVVCALLDVSFLSPIIRSGFLCLSDY
jgi:hypothetical protein